ncbi:hypothetical protein TrRE_jg10474 [Triparma retinervis]|uniref:Uncharacterized protein n=1 Tax=Triparma retinervis TaxID=2557542 RepID=A0A9W7DWK1_9STRA|nr:hypothetical protein TrRE_jg10474 [Triparma retinervis]
MLTSMLTSISPTPTLADTQMGPSTVSPSTPLAPLAPPAPIRPNWSVPTELSTSDEFTAAPLNANRRTSERLAGQMAARRRSNQATERVLKSPFSLTLKDTLSSLLFGANIYLFSSSRDSPLLTLLGGLFYGPREPWVSDRLDGLFSPPPPLMLAFFFSLTAFLGLLTDRAVLLATGGDADAALQLAGVSVIGAGLLELARVDGGEKSISREEEEAARLRREEFEEFAGERMAVGGGERSCHKRDVVRSFRRYYSKYRVETEDGVTDRDIEGLFVEWNKIKGTGKPPTKAGFVKGVVVKEDVLIT